MLAAVQVYECDHDYTVVESKVRLCTGCNRPEVDIQADELEDLRQELAACRAVIAGQERAHTRAIGSWMKLAEVYNEDIKGLEKRVCKEYEICL